MNNQNLIPVLQLMLQPEAAGNYRAVYGYGNSPMLARQNGLHELCQRQRRWKRSSLAVDRDVDEHDFLFHLWARNGAKS